MTLDEDKVFKILKIGIAVLVSVLLLINLLYIKAACTTRECLIVNFATIVLLLWATAFWLVVLKYSKK